MAILDREALKALFSAGRVPSGTDFADLLDTVAMLDDVKTEVETGWGDYMYPVKPGELVEKIGVQVLPTSPVPAGPCELRVGRAAGGDSIIPAQIVSDDSTLVLEVNVLGAQPFGSEIWIRLPRNARYTFYKR